MMKAKIDSMKQYYSETSLDLNPGVRCSSIQNSLGKWTLWKWKMEKENGNQNVQV